MCVYMYLGVLPPQLPLQTYSLALEHVHILVEVLCYGGASDNFLTMRACKQGWDDITESCKKCISKIELAAMRVCMFKKIQHNSILAVCQFATLAMQPVNNYFISAPFG